MTAYQEGDIEIEFPSKAQVRKFDDKKTHGLSHCMKAVDFIVELSDRILFIEVKDPDNPAAPTANRAEFLRQFLGGEIDRALVVKFRDSFLYEWAAERLGKPIHYLVLIAIGTLDDAMLLARTEALKREIPFEGPSDGGWKKKLVHHCAVFNVASWNRLLSDYCVNRLKS